MPGVVEVPGRGVRGYVCVALTAVGRDNAVHAEVFHELPVVIERVGYGVDGEAEASALPGDGIAVDWLDLVFLIDRGCSLVKRGE